MWLWPTILGERGSDGSELIYVIAVLILAAVGAIFEKIKRKMAEPEDKPGRPPVPRGIADQHKRVRPAPPPRPSGRRQPPRAWPVGQAPPPRAAAPAVRLPLETPRLVPDESPRGVSRPAPAEPELRPAVEAEVIPQLVGELSRGPERRPAATPGRRPSDLVADVGSFRKLSLAEVRRAIVLNEILSPPLALRDAKQTWDQS